MLKQLCLLPLIELTCYKKPPENFFWRFYLSIKMNDTRTDSLAQQLVEFALPLRLATAA